MRKFPPEASGNSTGGLHTTLALQKLPFKLFCARLHLGRRPSKRFLSAHIRCNTSLVAARTLRFPGPVPLGERPPCVWLAHTARARTVHLKSCASRNLPVARAMPLSERPPCVWLIHTARARSVHSRTRDLFFHQDDLHWPTSRCFSPRDDLERPTPRESTIPSDFRRRPSQAHTSDLSDDANGLPSFKNKPSQILRGDLLRPTPQNCRMTQMGLHPLKVVQTLVTEATISGPHLRPVG